MVWNTSHLFIQGLPALSWAGLPAVFLEDLSAVLLAGLPAVIFIRRLYGGMADWRNVLGKNGCCEEECKPIIIRDAGGAPRAIPWHHLVPRFASRTAGLSGTTSRP
jgi:hypothetical protein